MTKSGGVAAMVAATGAGGAASIMEASEQKRRIRTTTLNDEEGMKENRDSAGSVFRKRASSTHSIDLPPFKQTFMAASVIQPEQYFSRFNDNSWQFCATIGFFQIIFIVLFGLFVKYDDDWWADIQNEKNPIEKAKLVKVADEELSRTYAWFQDVHVMIIVGFGFLMTFLKRYSWSALGFNFLFAGFTVQWAILVQGWFFDSHHGAEDNDTTNNVTGPYSEPNVAALKFIHVDLMAMIEAEFSTGAILISFGAVLGVASPVQLLIMIILEIVFYKLNAYVILDIYGISDIGGSLVIHAFGAYFGLSVARCLFKRGHIDNPAEGGEYHSDIFSLIGTVFLWMFWPSFNSAPGPDSDTSRYMAVVNTYLALCASCMATYASSIWATPGRKITMEHVQNATLAGGVAMGTAASMPVQPFGALLIGSCAGILSTMGYSFIKPALSKAVNLHDTCGVHNLHGMPAVLAGIASVITCAAGWTTDNFATGREMALYQLAGLGTTLGIAIVGGAITGFIMNIPIWEQLEHEEYFEDGKYWEMDVYQVPEEDEQSDDLNY